MKFKTFYTEYKTCNLAVDDKEEVTDITVGDNEVEKERITVSFENETN